ncbi:hypothetical protein BX266_6530 [Streptomyces sp. TLI_171]|nr:hypothetical protein BX266_6530 [Streptomyces sp. TLI_171]
MGAARLTHRQVVPGRGGAVELGCALGGGMQFMPVQLGLGVGTSAAGARVEGSGGRGELGGAPVMSGQDGRSVLPYSEIPSSRYGPWLYQPWKYTVRIWVWAPTRIVACSRVSCSPSAHRYTASVSGPPRTPTKAYAPETVAVSS